jgi:hypothetical protein
MAETNHCGEHTLHLMLLGLMAFFFVSCHRNETKPYSQWTEVQKRNYFVDSFAYVTGSGKYFELVGQDSGKLFGSFINQTMFTIKKQIAEITGMNIANTIAKKYIPPVILFNLRIFFYRLPVASLFLF